MYMLRTAPSNFFDTSSIPIVPIIGKGSAISGHNLDDCHLNIWAINSFFSSRDLYMLPRGKFSPLIRKNQKKYVKINSMPNGFFRLSRNNEPSTKNRIGRNPSDCPIRSFLNQP